MRGMASIRLREVLFRLLLPSTPRHAFPPKTVLSACPAFSLFFPFGRQHPSIHEIGMHDARLQELPCKVCVPLCGVL